MIRKKAKTLWRAVHNPCCIETIDSLLFIGLDDSKKRFPYPGKIIWFSQWLFHYKLFEAHHTGINSNDSRDNRINDWMRNERKERDNQNRKGINLKIKGNYWYNNWMHRLVTIVPQACLCACMYLYVSSYTYTLYI